ncbi:DegT/DnrJ/EryC1/StrS family aminotransferase [Georgenia yuyongxinii]
MTDRIYLSAPDVGPAEEAALVRALRSGWVAPLGPEVDAFEREVAARAGRAHAVALSSGTAALHLGLLTLGVGPGDVVITGTMTFAATANAIVYNGARPVFVDCDKTGNLSPALLRAALAGEAARGHRVGAVVAVDLFGKVADYPAIEAIAAEAGVPVFSDAAESLGAERGGRPAGSFGDAAALSFNGNKIMTTSGGGMLLTDEEAVARRVRHLATQAREPVVHYEHHEVGYNYRLSNVLAALGRAQLGRLDTMLARRRAIRGAYRGLFAGVPGVRVFGEADGTGRTGSDEVESTTRDNCWLTSILVDPEVAGWTASELMAHLAEADIESRPLWKPMHRQPVFAGMAAYLDGTADDHFARGLSLPSSSALDDDALARVLKRVSSFVGAVIAA